MIYALILRVDDLVSINLYLEYGYAIKVCLEPKSEVQLNISNA